MGVSRLNLVYKKSPQHCRGLERCRALQRAKLLDLQERRLHFQVLKGVGHFLEALGNDRGNDEAHDEPADAHAIGE